MGAGSLEPLQLTPRLYVVLAALASAAMLAAAHAFERFGGYQPCALCLLQREVYWTALAVAAGGLALLRVRTEVTRVVPALLAAIFATGAFIAGYHALVEWKVLPLPAGCGGVGLAEAAGMAALLGGEKMRLVLCDEAAWSLFGLSMAGWNALISLGLAGLGLWAATRREGRPRALEIARA